MAAVKIPYVWRRGDSWQYRRRVPEDLQEAIGKVNWYRTWKPDTDIETVMREAKQLARRHDRQIEAARVATLEGQARSILKQPVGERVASLAYLAEHDERKDTGTLLETVQSGGRYHRPTLLSEAVARHSEGKDKKPFHHALKRFKEVHGDLDVTVITRSDVADWLAFERARGVKPSTIRRRLDALRAAVNRAHLDMDHPGRNPFEQHRIVGGQGSPSDRVPLHRQHLAKLDDYIASAKRLRPDTRNLITLLRWTGAGTAEVAGIEVRDVILDHETPHVWIRPNAVRSLKTSARDRQVPLLPEALEATRDAVSHANGPNLFDGYDRGGRGAEYFSSRLNQILRRAGIPRSPRLTVYSLRHCWVEALHAAGIRERLIRYIVGHSGRDIHGKYGADRAQLSEALAAMERAAPLLGEIDESNYQAGELA